MKKFRNLALIAAGAAVALFGVSLVSSTSGASLPVPAPADQEAFINAAESTINGVVSVKSYATPRQAQYDAFTDPFFEYFFGSPSQGRRNRPNADSQEQQQRQIGLGSGVIISSDGYIVTNNHVIAEAERLEVTLNDNRNYNATVVGADELTDLALIKIDAPDLHVIPMGNSEDLRVGEWVLAVGNPFGFTSTVTSGIVSAKARNISALTQTSRKGNIESYIQTDAALNAGNSGGALVNLQGELVGINTAIYSQTGNYAGCSFAIPTSIVNKVVGDLKEYGTVQRAMLGIRYADLTPELVREKDIKGVNAGIYVHAIEELSAANEAGLQEGDVIVAINDHEVVNTAQIQEALAKCSPGQTITITYYRNGKKSDATGTLRNGRGNTEIVKIGAFSDLGCTFGNVSDKTKQQLGISHGVVVEQLGPGSMQDAGIREGFILLSINGMRLRKADDVEKIYKSIASSDDQEKVMFITGVYPTGKTAYYAVPVGE